MRAGGEAFPQIQVEADQGEYDLNRFGTLVAH